LRDILPPPLQRIRIPAEFSARRGKVASIEAVQCREIDIDAGACMNANVQRCKWRVKITHPTGLWRVKITRPVVGMKKEAQAMVIGTLIGTLIMAAELPEGAAPAPVSCSHFPSRLHAFIWRNWQLVPASRLAKVVKTDEPQIANIAKAMGLPPQARITENEQRRSYITVIRRNWHLLPYDQLLELLDWKPEQLAYTLREDDFLYIKLGLLKPKCERLVWSEPSPEIIEREKKTAEYVKSAYPDGIKEQVEPLFSFVRELSSPPPARGRDAEARASAESVFSPRYCYSYFALYGDPLMDANADPFPDGYLARIQDSGVDGVWLQGVLFKLAPFPWDKSLSEGYETRRKNLRKIVLRAAERGVKVYMYLNEPRSMPLSFFSDKPQLKGPVEGDHAALCTGDPEVKDYIRSSVAAICRAVPELGGFFTITSSENLTNCWSHYQGKACPRCSKRSPDEAIAEVNALIQQGINEAGSKACLFAWDWGWQDEWAEAAIKRLPAETGFMSVSEWSMPITRGGVPSVVGEYSISTVGPGPRATKHWACARQRGLKLMAKVQANTTWEIGSVPYVPAVRNVARHAMNLCGAEVDGLMLSWTLGGCPSPNLEAMAEIGRLAAKNPPPKGGPEAEAFLDGVLSGIAERRFGKAAVPGVVKAWNGFSAAFCEYPYHPGLVYNAPQHMGPSNPLWDKPTGYRATMTGLPYDDLDGWRVIYPPEVFIAQFDKVADGFAANVELMRKTAAESAGAQSAEERKALSDEINVAEACGIHFRSCANQARFVVARGALAAAKTKAEAIPQIETLEKMLLAESALAARLYAVQCRDSRIGFEATNHYFYIPFDLIEKQVNCRHLREEWLGQIKAKWQTD